MYRDIKFRAFDKIDKFIKKVHTINFHGSCVTLQDKVGYRIVRRFEDISLMPYTGLKDKHGVEIYDGDIVQCTCGDCDGFRYIVQFQDGAFCLNDTKFPIGSWIMNFKDLENLEIIGNIYENKELLENG